MTCNTVVVAAGRTVRGTVRSSTRLGREVIKTADWVIDLGPEGGDKPVLSEVEGGGEIVAEGTPEDVAQVARSYTGGYLKALLTDRRNAVAAE